MASTALDYRTPRALWITAAFVVAVIAVGSVIGINSAPGAWYQSLAKPPFNPPNWVFAPVWLVLYVAIGIAGARSFMRSTSVAAFVLWSAQMVLNWAWSPTWFTMHLLWVAFAIIVAILALIVAFIVASWKVDRVAAWLFVPYALWVAFALSLNLAVALLN